MTPELWVNENKVADVPDQSGIYDSPVGEVIIDASKIDPHNQENLIGVKASGMGRSYVLDCHDGTRWIPLSREGEGSEDLSVGKKLTVKLKRNIVSVDHRNGVNSHTKPAGARRVVGEYSPDSSEKTWGAERDIKKPLIKDWSRDPDVARAIVLFSSTKDEAQKTILIESSGSVNLRHSQLLSQRVAEMSDGKPRFVRIDRNGQLSANREASEGSAAGL